MGIQQMLLGVGGGETVADWFATKTYSGTSSSNSINTGLDMVGKEGIIWTKATTGSYAGQIVGSKGSTGGAWNGVLEVNSTSGDLDSTTEYLTPTSTGFTANSTVGNDAGADYVSWTFLKAEKFFDIVDYEGDAPNEQTISHDLGCLPGMIIVKKYDIYGTARNWCVYHKHMDGTNSKDDYMYLNDYANKATSSHMWANTDPTTTNFKLDNNDQSNDASRKYVGYLFADDEKYIKCGSYTSAAGVSVDLGWEPQFLMIKQASGTAGSAFSNWFMFDNVRMNGDYNNRLWANTTDSQDTSGTYMAFTEDGFTISSGVNGLTNPISDNYIYMAIRKAA